MLPVRAVPPIAVALVLVLLAPSLAWAQGSSPAQREVEFEDVRVSALLVRVDALPEGHIARPTVEFRPGDAGVVAFLAANNGTENRSVRVTPLSAPQELSGLDPASWESRPLASADVDEGRRVSDQTAWHFEVLPQATVGASLTLRYRVEILDDANETLHAESLEFGILLVAPPPRPNPLVEFYEANPLRAWLLVGLAAVGGGYVAWKRRRPRIKPRSRALRAEQAQRGAAPPAEAVEETAAEKESRILRAKRADVERSIENARLRMERGEITSFQFENLKQSKEANLAELDRKMRELGVGGPRE
ncbi:MAG TPA: hypothetical protein VM681_01490 [Candidatus Thermoplasmatota archaeon]|nr:hypothetical protein [Candidatus Thermoplasmatota archaeon]